jgi:hypothetical protein
MKGTKERKKVHLEDGSVWTYIIERVPGAWADDFKVRIYSPEGKMFRPTEGQLASVITSMKNKPSSSFAPSVVKFYILTRILPTFNK